MFALVLNLSALGHATAKTTKTVCPSDDLQYKGGSENASQPASRTGCQTGTIEPRKESIVVTGTFAPLPAEHIDRPISVIDTREESLLYTHGVDYLQLDSSVDLQQRAPNGVQGNLSIRGDLRANTGAAERFAH